MTKRIARPRPKVTVATTSPTPTDDASKGYQYFSQWYNSDTGELFTCVDPAVGAASWKEEATDSGGVHVDTRDPIDTDDSSKGYQVGHLWLNTVKQELWSSIVDTVDNAVWRDVTDLSHLDYVVGPVGYARFQIVQAGVDQAVTDGHDAADPAVVYVLDGTYVEDVTLYPGVSLEAVNKTHGHGEFPPVCPVYIQGSLTYASGSSGGTVYVRCVRVNPTTGVAITITGTAIKTMIFTDCYLRSEDASVIQHTGSNWVIVVGRTSYIVTDSATLPVMVVAGEMQFVLEDSFVSLSSLTAAVVQLTGGVFICLGKGGQYSGTLGGIVDVASGMSTLRLIGVRFVNEAPADVVVTGNLNVTKSIFMDAWHQGFTAEDRTPITIGGPNASQFKEAPQAAVAGDIWRYSGTQWGIAPLPALVRANQDMTAQNTTMDEDLACSTTMAYTPTHDGQIKVLVNGVAVEVGDGSKVAYCYFSGDGGTNVRNIKDVVAGDLLYWMGSVAGFELETTKDKVSFDYVGSQS